MAPRNDRTVGKWSWLSCTIRSPVVSIPTTAPDPSTTGAPSNPRSTMALHGRLDVVLRSEGEHVGRSCTHARACRGAFSPPGARQGRRGAGRRRRRPPDRGARLGRRPDRGGGRRLPRPPGRARPGRRSAASSPVSTSPVPAVASRASPEVDRSVAPSGAAHDRGRALPEHDRAQPCGQRAGDADAIGVVDVGAEPGELAVVGGEDGGVRRARTGRRRRCAPSAVRASPSTTDRRRARRGGAGGPRRRSRVRCPAPDRPRARPEPLRARPPPSSAHPPRAAATPTASVGRPGSSSTPGVLSRT